MNMMIKIETIVFNKRMSNQEVAYATKHILANGYDLKRGLYLWFDPFTGTMSKKPSSRTDESAFVFKMCNN